MIDNPVLRHIKTRFSCRSFLNTPVEDEKLRAVIEAGTYAPSGRNEQSWHFTVIRTEEGKQLLLQAAGDTPPPAFLQVHPGGTWPFQSDFCGAPVVIVISGRPDVPWPEAGPMLAAENIMLAAHSMGLATLWSTPFTKDLFRDGKSAAAKPRLMPLENKPFATLFLGYPAQVPVDRPPRRSDVETWI